MMPKSIEVTNSIVTVIIFLFTKLPWPGDSRGTFQSSNQAGACPSVYHTRWRLYTVPFKRWMSSREAVNTNFDSLWFDPTGNRTRVYCFSSRRSIHSTRYAVAFATGFVLHQWNILQKQRRNQNTCWSGLSLFRKRTRCYDTKTSWWSSKYPARLTRLSIFRQNEVLKTGKRRKNENDAKEVGK